MEIAAPGIVVSVTPFSEGDAVVAVFTEDHGIYRGLARGGMSRTKASLWQAGNLVQARWVARLEDQLGSFSAELIHAGAALAMQDAWALGILSSLCAVADTALQERQPYQPVFRGVLHMIAHSGEGAALLPDLVRWELGLLRELGYGLDIEICALTGSRQGLAYVSPRTGRAVCAEAAGHVGLLHINGNAINKGHRLVGVRYKLIKAIECFWGIERKLTAGKQIQAFINRFFWRPHVIGFPGIDTCFEG